jgi:hypothetical protein
VRLGECMKLINRRIWDLERNLAQRRAKGLQVAPLLHRIRELEYMRREIGALETPKMEGEPRSESVGSGAPAK